MRRESMPRTVRPDASSSDTPERANEPDNIGGSSLRRGHGNVYTPTHAAFRGQGRWVGSCGRCGKHVESAPGQKKHPILGKLCTPCSGAVR